MLYRYQPIVVFLVFMSLFYLSPQVCADSIMSKEKEVVVIGVAPFMSPLALVKRFTPLRIYLSDLLEKEVILETSTEANAFLERTRNGRYNYILTSPTFAMKAQQSGGYKVLLMQQDKLVGRFVVLNSSPIKELAELNGKVIGVPPKIGFLGQVVRPTLVNKFHPEQHSIKVVHFRSHIDSVLALKNGAIDASLIAGFMEQHIIAKGINIRVIDSTEEFPGLAFLSLVNEDVKEQEIIKDALIKLDKNKEGRELLKKISMSSFREMQSGEFDFIKKYFASH